MMSAACLLILVLAALSQSSMSDIQRDRSQARGRGRLDLLNERKVRHATSKTDLNSAALYIPANMLMDTDQKLNSTVSHCYNNRYKRYSTTGNSWRSELVAAARKWSKDNATVLTGGDWGYRATVLNWMAHAEHVNMTQYVVLCYGRDMLSLVGSVEDGGHGVLVLDCNRLIEYMFMKLIGMYHLNKARLTAVWSDADALWLRPGIMEMWILPYKDRVDILAQKALHPTEVSETAGSAVCTGLFAVFPSKRSKAAMESIVRAVRRFRIASDQLLVNRQLASLDVFNFRGKVLFDDLDSPQEVVMPRYRKYATPRLGFLPSGVFPRSRTDDAWAYVQRHNPAVWHSKTEKSGASKIDGMKSSSLFALKDGWEHITVSADIPVYIDHKVFFRKNGTEASTAAVAIA